MAWSASAMGGGGERGGERGALHGPIVLTIVEFSKVYPYALGDRHSLLPVHGSRESAVFRFRIA